MQGGRPFLFDFDAVSFDYYLLARLESVPFEAALDFYGEVIAGCFCASVIVNIYHVIPQTIARSL